VLVDTGVRGRLSQWMMAEEAEHGREEPPLKSPLPQFFRSDLLTPLDWMERAFRIAFELCAAPKCDTRGMVMERRLPPNCCMLHTPGRTNDLGCAPRQQSQKCHLCTLAVCIRQGNL